MEQFEFSPVVEGSDSRKTSDKMATVPYDGTEVGPDFVTPTVEVPHDNPRADLPA